MLFDANKKLVSVGDAFPDSYECKNLPKGSYTLRLHFRHDNIALLEKLSKLNIILERPLAKVFCREIGSEKMEEKKRKEKSKKKRKEMKNKRKENMGGGAVTKRKGP